MRAGGLARCLIVIVAIIFGTTSRERLVRGLSPTNCDSPAVTSPNNHYQVPISTELSIPYVVFIFYYSWIAVAVSFCQ